MANKPPDVIVPITFDDEALGTDLEHLSDAAGTALTQLRREVDRDGGLPEIVARDLRGEKPEAPGTPEEDAPG